MIAHMFPGQGAQRRGMGEGLFEDFRTLTASASEVLGYDVRELCEHDPQGRLGDTRYTQPALFTVCMMAWIRQFERTGIEPDIVAGHSLGEITALAVAGVFDFRTALALVKLRGELMAEARGGAMLAVLDAPRAELEEALSGYPEVCVANENTDSQLVVSGELAQVEALEPTLGERRWRAVRLPVSGAFHSSLMVEPARRFREALDRIEPRAPSVPVVANATARPYPTEPDALRDTLAMQMRSPVRWSDSVRYIRRQSIDGDGEFHEFGPGRVLTEMLPKVT